MCGESVAFLCYRVPVAALSEDGHGNAVPLPSVAEETEGKSKSAPLKTTLLNSGKRVRHAAVGMSESRIPTLLRSHLNKEHSARCAGLRCYN
jgi:hypothetical protein